jgi:hypothetical protein
VEGLAFCRRPNLLPAMLLVIVSDEKKEAGASRTRLAV